MAYRQPVTRAEIENVRGVDAGAVLRSLLERKLVRLHGHKEVAGRPMLYGTSARFLEVFGLETLNDLPSLREIAELMPAGEAAGSGEGDSEPAESEFESALGFDSAPDAAAAFEDSEPVGKPH